MAGSDHGVSEQSDEPTALEVFCPSCGGVVALQIANWGVENLANSPWTCPYCQGAHHISLAGRLVGVARKEAPPQVH